MYEYLSTPPEERVRRDSLIRELYDEGNTDMQIALELDIPRNYVYSYRKRNKLAANWSTGIRSVPAE